MNHYVVTQGEYSDYRIRSVFSDKAEAEKYIATYSAPYDEMQLEEYEDGTCPAPYHFKALIDIDGVLRAVTRLEPPEEYQHVIYPDSWCYDWLGGTTVLGVVQYGQTEQEAIKIAAEKHAQIKAVMAGVA